MTMAKAKHTHRHTHRPLDDANVIAGDLRSPKYRLRIVANKKKIAKIPRLEM